MTCGPGSKPLTDWDGGGGGRRGVGGMRRHCHGYDGVAGHLRVRGWRRDRKSEASVRLRRLYTENCVLNLDITSSHGF